MPGPYTIWCNADFSGDNLDLLQSSVGPHRLVTSAQSQSSNLVAGGPDPLLADADIAFGQPDANQLLETPRLRWVHLTSAGYTRYDTPEIRQTLATRGGLLTNSSAVYADPCAQHVLAMMLSLARRLPYCLDEQRHARGWPSHSIRSASFLLNEQTVLIYGYGAIGRRLTELLQPFQMRVIGVRRSAASGSEPAEMMTPEQAESLLPEADHVVDILPASPHTEEFFNADRLTKLKRSAVFYNIGRGSTVDRYALQAMLETHRLSAAYLDVTTPEPLPPPSALWKLPNCFITPHSAGGHRDEPLRLVRHFLANLRRYEANQPLLDRVF